MRIKPEKQEAYNKYVEINTPDIYSKAVIDAGEAFGNAVDEGKSFDEADVIMSSTVTGMTGYMAGAAMSALVNFHLRGQEIKEWWNKKWGGTGQEGGVVNPAIINIKEKNDEGDSTS
jgi:hypothetical protein